MKNKVSVEVEFDGNYGASIDILQGCVAVADTFHELRSLMDEAVEMHLESMRKYGDVIPDEFQSDYELVYKLDSQALLVAYDGILTKSALSRMSGINEKQLWHYSSGIKHPRPAQRIRIKNAIHQLGQELLSVEL